ncbi:uncharacterized protein LOC131249745 [Magnolia sinica]|uniref:uncharacterized protein LOC131249745 n=1 Tax=Magnolia sinica TaxID=86752 RepID=UPI002659E81C|nr:uncharacterized protein LOC131249745 [Magnolia sinica]
MWAQHDGFKQVVSEAWKSDIFINPMIHLLLKMGSTEEALKRWNWETFGNIFAQIKVSFAKVEKLEQEAIASPTTSILSSLDKERSNLQCLKFLEEVFWKQKFRNRWLKEGDRNSKFFHTLVTNRIRRSHISQVVLQDGSITSDQAQKKAAASDFFKLLYSAEAITPIADSSIKLPPLVSLAYNDFLLTPPIVEEVKLVVSSLPVDGTPGPDGFSRVFFSSCWNIVAEDLYRVVKFLFQGGLTQSFPTLFPMSKWHLSKIDLDRVSWPFLKAVLLKFGFSRSWISIVEQCWTSPWFLVLFNGEATSFFNSERGLRQGDPLSPSLFILVMDVLNRGLHNLFSTNLCKSYKTRRGNLTISHLLFADDTTVFINGGSTSLNNLMAFLQNFNRVSGLKINLTKSSFMVSSARSRIWRTERLTGITRATSIFSYLGVSLSKGKIWATTYQPLVKRIVSRIAGWKAHFLNQAARVTLIKHVLSSIPIHTLAAVDILNKTLTALEFAFADFFWGRSNGKKNLHRVS